MAFRIIAGDVQDAVSAAVTAAVDATSPRDPVPVSVGFPDDLRAEHIWVDGSFEADFPRYISGGSLRDEQATLPVRIRVAVAKGSMPEVRDRTLQLAGYVESGLADDPTLGGLVSFARIVRAEGQYGLVDGMREYGLTLSVAYELPVSAGG